MTSNIKGQQETVGFIVIIVMVMIIGVIFLGISLRKGGGVETKSAEISNFLSSTLAYTTECYKDSEPNYRTLADLAKDCFSHGAVTCPENKDSCDILNSTYSEMLQKLSPAGVLKYYRLDFRYNDSTSEHSFKEIKQGSLTGCKERMAGREQINMGGQGNVIIELETCENSD